MTDSPQYGAPARLTAASIGLGVLLSAMLIGAYVVYTSQLALAQAADSFTDTFTALALLYSLRVSAAPADENHPGGHHRAEPIAALLAAVLAGVLAVEVFRNAVTALHAGDRAQLEIPLAVAFTIKIAAKSVLSRLAGRHHRITGSPALRALQVDARNDVLVGVLALAGFFGAYWGWPTLDIWLAMPIAVWIAASGLALGAENIRLLMGEAPPMERQRELLTLALGVDGVLSGHDFAARYDGVQLQVTMHVVVDEGLSLRAAHDVAEAVEARLRDQQDVLSAMVHVDVEHDGG